MITHTVFLQRFRCGTRRRVLSLHRYKPCVPDPGFIYKSISRCDSSIPVRTWMHFLPCFLRKQFHQHFHLPRRWAPFIDKYSILEAANWFPIRPPHDTLFHLTFQRGKYGKGYMTLHDWKQSTRVAIVSRFWIMLKYCERNRFRIKDYAFELQCNT